MELCVFAVRAWFNPQEKMLLTHFFCDSTVLHKKSNIFRFLINIPLRLTVKIINLISLHIARHFINHCYVYQTDQSPSHWLRITEINEGQESSVSWIFVTLCHLLTTLSLWCNNCPLFFFFFFKTVFIQRTCLESDLRELFIHTCTETASFVIKQVDSSESRNVLKNHPWRCRMRTNWILYILKSSIVYYFILHIIWRLGSTNTIHLQIQLQYADILRKAK